MFMKSNTLKLK